jgi:outer membrane lipoprotein-sorting protein
LQHTKSTELFSAQAGQRKRSGMAIAFSSACVLALLFGLHSTAIAQSGAAGRELGAFANAWASINGYSARVAIFDQKGTQSQNLLFNYTFQKPSNVTVDIITGPNAGVNLAWDGGSSVVAHHGSGLAAMFKKTVSLHDPLVTTLQGSSIDQLSFGAILAHGQQAAGTLSETPGETIDGVATNAVTLTVADPATDTGLTREVLELSTLTNLPMRVLGYEGSALVRKVDFSNVAIHV